ncbi:glycosyltransferase family 2 protein [Flavobacterium limnophilum]|uniref:glycosyltransferase family 2 protein n=1 Tax=Flavobacterium limnophilum TaxID=3003262 RepID=UPI002482858F|nr:glycosyltransferase family A protein [Flavobacterium limnophilum]
MQDTTLVTVICSCFNHQEFVGKSIQSVLNQTHKKVQIIVVDDNSTDNSVEEIEKYVIQNPEIIFIKNKTNLGITKSVTNAMRYVKGDYFIDLAADDVLQPNCIEIQLNTFKNSHYKNLALVYGNAELITEDGNHSSYYFDVDEDLKTKTKRPSGNIYSNVISSETIICSVSSMYKKEIFDKLNGYDTTLSYEDFDFWIRVSRDYNIEFIDEILIKKRITTNSLQTTLYTKKNKNSYSTYIILRKAYKLNKNKNEHTILTKRVNFEILNSYRTGNYVLMLKNMYLRFQIGLKSI